VEQARALGGCRTRRRKRNEPRADPPGQRDRDANADDQAPLSTGIGDARMVPNRMARNVPASIRALPATSRGRPGAHSRAKLIRAKHGRVRAEAEQRDERSARSRPRTGRARRLMRRSRDLHPARDLRLVDAIGQRPRCAREQEEQRVKTAPASMTSVDASSRLLRPGDR
jgi:hypothetical protein